MWINEIEFVNKLRFFPIGSGFIERRGRLPIQPEELSGRQVGQFSIEKVNQLLRYGDVQQQRRKYSPLDTFREANHRRWQGEAGNLSTNHKSDLHLHSGESNWQLNEVVKFFLLPNLCNFVAALWHRCQLEVMKRWEDEKCGKEENKPQPTKTLNW